MDLEVKHCSCGLDDFCGIWFSKIGLEIWDSWAFDGNQLLKWSDVLFLVSSSVKEC